MELKDIVNFLQGSRNIYYGTVIDNNDPLMFGRIRVHPEGEVFESMENSNSDFKKNSSSTLDGKWGKKDPLIFLPLLPYYINQVPQKDERVLIIYYNNNMADSEIISYPTIDEEFKRSNHATNAKGLTQEEIEKRDIETAEMMKLYPKINPLWADLIWNFCHRTPQERLDEIINNKEFEDKPTKEYQKGGTYKGIVVEEHEEKHED